MNSEVDVNPGIGGCSASEPFALQVLDTSMMPEFPPGCVVIVDPSAPLASGAYVVIAAGRGLRLQRLIDKDGQWWLQSTCGPVFDDNGNPVCKPLGERGTSLVGRVIQRGGKRRGLRRRF